MEGVNFSRAGHFNPITWKELYVCSEYKRFKCPCTAVARYHKRPTEEGPKVSNNDKIINDNIDPRKDIVKYYVVRD